jgi:hypothetical protein
VATFPGKGEVIDVEAEGLMEGKGDKEGDLMPPETQKTPAKVPETRATRKSGVEGEDWLQKGKRTDKRKAAAEVVEEEEEGPEEGGRFVPVHLHKVSAWGEEDCGLLHHTSPPREKRRVGTRRAVGKKKGREGGKARGRRGGRAGNNTLPKRHDNDRLCALSLSPPLSPSLQPPSSPPPRR